MIILTGGEPLLKPDLVLQAIDEIREQNLHCGIILYTAKVDDLESIRNILFHRRKEGVGIDGITLTLHTQRDVKHFNIFNQVLKSMSYLIDWKPYSFRLNIFKGIKLNGIDPGPWQLKENIQWIKKCPLPINEVFKRYEL